MKENTIRGEISRCFPLFVCFPYLSGKSEITSFMAKYTEEFQTLHLIALSLKNKKTSVLSENKLTSMPTEHKNEKSLCWFKLKLKYICGTKSYSALFLKY